MIPYIYYKGTYTQETFHIPKSLDTNKQTFICTTILPLCALTQTPEKTQTYKYRFLSLLASLS